MKGDWMQTYTGRRFWPLDPVAGDIEIMDIAHALSNQCRYAGHTRFHYSVAQHSVLVSENVAPEHALWGLLHDASEAYLVDVPRPVKPHLPGYYEAEERVQKAVAERFGLSWPMPAEVKRVDDAILADEWSYLMQTSALEAGISAPPLGVRIYRISPGEARARFLGRFRDLAGYRL